MRFIILSIIFILFPFFLANSACIFNCPKTDLVVSTDGSKNKGNSSSFKLRSVSDLLSFKDNKHENRDPLSIYFEIVDNNQLKRNSFKEFDTYFFSIIFGAAEKCSTRWGGLPGRNDIGEKIKDISFEEHLSYQLYMRKIFQVYNSKFIGGKKKLPCYPKGTNKTTILNFINEYLSALELASENIEKYHASINELKMDKTKKTAEIRSAENQNKSSLAENERERKKEERIIADVEDTQKIEKLVSESATMIVDILEYAKLPNKLDTITLAEYFINFKSFKVNEWNSEKINSYKLLVKYLMSDEGFILYRQNKVQERNLIKQEKIDDLKLLLVKYDKILKEFVSNNLGSDLSANAITLSKKIQNIDENIMELDQLVIETSQWFKDNSITYR